MIIVDADPCRVCLSPGTWNIFGSNVIDDEMCTVASINHIRDKLQYVTQLQMNANDGLPFRICELCIVQLNLAYRFKQLATDSDSKLREQYQVREETSLPEIQNAPVHVDDAVIVEDALEGLSFLKQEPKPSTNEISVNLSMVCESSTARNTPINEASGIPNSGTVTGMVYLQTDIINPAEDEAFIKDILKKEVITMPWPIIAECTSSTTTGNSPPSEKASPIKPQTPPSPPKQFVARKKPRKSPPKRRNSEGSDGQEGESLGLENVSQNPQKRAKKIAKQSTREPMAEGASNRSKAPTSNAGSVKGSTKPSKATMRRRRLQKVLESLRIDMVDDKLLERHSMAQTSNASKIIPMKRRNSICVSSLPPWL